MPHDTTDKKQTRLGCNVSHSVRLVCLNRSEFQCLTDAAGDASDESRDASGNGGGTN